MSINSIAVLRFLDSNQFRADFLTGKKLFRKNIKSKFLRKTPIDEKIDLFEYHKIASYD